MVRFFSFSALALMALVSVASAQSSATSTGSNTYSVSLDGSSVGTLSDLTIDESRYAYNLILPYSFDPSNPYYAPYTSVSGPGSAYADEDPDSYYDSSSMMGYAGIASGAFADPASGMAVASVGSELDLTLTNDGTDDVILNVSSFASISGSASATGTHGEGSNYAKVDTYAGFRDYSQSFSGPVNLFYVNLTGNDLGTSTNVVGPWSSLGGGDYGLDFQVTIKPGETRAFSFWTSSVNRAAVPEPASLAALGLGAAALMRRRRKA